MGEAWGNLLVAVMHGLAEIMVRAVRDLYADCLSSLPGLIERGDPAALHFYFANFVGMRRKLAPALFAAYEGWLATGDVRVIETAATEGLVRWRATSEELLDLHAVRGDAVAAQIEARLDPRVKC